MSRNPLAPPAQGPRQRLCIEATGAVQGVGFRPFVHRLAVSEGLAGFVRNTGQGVLLEVEGSTDALARFVARFESETAPPAFVQERRIRQVALKGEHEFAIASSTRETGSLAVVLPDLAVCAECLDEVSDPSNRRYRYPFTTCVRCGPRFSIIEDIPYDRARTTMRRFTVCATCQAEYDDPGSRRFHAETNACPVCGPRLMLWDTAGRERAAGDRALDEAADALRAGAIVAIKGLGGFQLLADARNELAVRRLRERKHRPTKPFAIMVPGYEEAQALAEICPAEQQVLGSAAAPIVLLRSRARSDQIAPSVAPANAWLGIMLPYTPLHHLLIRELGFPIVATSGNRGGEPIVADEREAIDRLAGLADLFLVHDRPIERPVDDSVVRVIAGEPVVLRHARGYAPLALAVKLGDARDAGPCLALGGHGKSAIAVTSGPQLVLGPYIGDLDGGEARAAFARSARGMTALYGVVPQSVACDAHPDYYSTQFAERSTARVRHVPHHVAHVLAGMVDNGLDGPILGVAWDGSGYGGDGTVWGGEFLALEGDRYRRVAQLQPFRLPGGEAAAREPNRAALGALHAVYGETALTMTELRPVAVLTARERQLFATMLAGGVHSPWTSSAGRLFDAAAAILGVCRRASFEGEAAIALEGTAERSARACTLAAPVLREEDGKLIADWRPTLAALANASQDSVPVAALAAAFHGALADIIADVARHIGIRRVLLTGGCFQNARLTERTVAQLHAAGFEVWCHRRVPPNDGGLGVGQAAFAVRPLIEERC
ncbi:carbamoyltransferase HypF (plasmid) [Burkholderia thailandensis]|uniref:carbamoyltransferase HypF n=1 Tax=Burkholderia thailandensis TaxID=57975 RepID=UPI00192E0B99|nr:carbamoyltransferase HypF [Burkholderia thailandensis]MBS2132200.1 carbamoyltransferase HypF [Burkholderia thailandensis]QRA15296.1 carbamoyltransferase HypF [Burkholderia thailandensis]